MGLVVGAVALGLSMDRFAMQVAAGGLLAVVLICRLSVRKARRIRAPAGHAGLALCSFMMSSVHGAGSKLVPALMPLCLGAAPARDITAGASLALACAAVEVHTVAMLTVAALISRAFATAFVPCGPAADF
jgi:hypothetical protein